MGIVLNNYCVLQVISMSLLQRQVEAMKSDIEVVGCSWFPQKQHGCQFFLRNYHTDEVDLKSSSEMKKIQSKASNTTKVSSSNPNKVSLKREKDKTSRRVGERLNTQSSYESYQSILAAQPFMYSYPAIMHPIVYYAIQPIQVNHQVMASTYANNPLQSPQNIQIPVHSAFVSEPSGPSRPTTSAPYINYQQQHNLKSDLVRPSTQTTMVPNKSQSNIGVDKKSFSGNSPQCYRECPDFPVFENEDDYFFHSLKTKGDIIKTNITKRRQKSNLFLNEEESSQFWIKERELNDSLLFQESIRSDISEESLSENGNKLHLKRMEDVEEIKSVADSNEQSDDDKESVVLGRLHQYGSVVKLHKEQHHKHNNLIKTNRGFVNISTIVKPIEYTP